MTTRTMTATGTTVLVDNNNSNSNGDDEDDEVAAAAAVSRSEATNSNSNIHNNEGSLVSLTRMDTSAYSATATARSSAPPVTLSQQHSPPAHDAPQSQASSSLQASSSIVRALFGPAVGPCYGDFFCTHHRIRGRLYATGLAVLYSSNLLGFERRICLRFCEIVELELHRTTSIRITMFDSESYVFRSFNDRVQVLHLLKALKAVSDRRLSGSGVARGFTGMSASVPLAPAASPSQLQRPRSEGHRLFESAAAATAATSVTAAQPSFPRPTSRRSEPLVSNRRRAVSDSLLRSARLDAEDGGDDQEGSGLTASPLHASFDLGAGRSGYSENDARGMEDDMDDDDDDDDEESVHTPSPDDTTQTAWSKAKESAIATAGTVGIESLVLPVSLETFYRLFLADGATHGLDWYQHHHVGDRDIQLTGWDLEESTGASSSSMAEVAWTRCMTFTHPLKKSALGVGPSEARTSRQQRLRRFGKTGMLVENTTVIVDATIPSGDTFYVQDYWLLEAHVGPPPTAHLNDKEHVTLTTRFGTRFTKRTLLRGIIEKNVLKETTKWFQGYAVMLQSKVSLVEVLPLDASVVEPMTAIVASAESASAAIPEPPIPTPVAAGNLQPIVDLLLQISVSMDRTLFFGAGALLVLLVVLLVQLVILRQTVVLLRDDLDTMHATLDALVVVLQDGRQCTNVDAIPS